MNMLFPNEWSSVINLLQDLQQYKMNTLQFPYKLHAVLVHEGQAASGHYWAYVFSHSRDKWLKFNDITVSEATWHELSQDSYGGYHNASAYCLMYVDATKQHLLEGKLEWYLLLYY